MNVGGSHPKQPEEGAAGYRQADALLQDSQYEQVAAILHIAQTKSAQAGDVVLTHMLDAARLLCVALIACHAEAERQRQACQETERREQELRQELCAILGLLSRGEMSRALPALERLPRISAPPTEPPQRHGLWRRIQDLLRPRTSSLPSRPEQADALSATVIPPYAIAPRPVATKTPFHAAAAPSPATETQPAMTGAQRPAERPQHPEAETQSPAPGTRLSRPPGDTPALTLDTIPPPKDQVVRSDPTLVVYCLGPFGVYQDDQFITDWTGQKSKSILKYLLANHKTPVAKDILMDVFWPDADPEAARRNLHQAIYSLRQTLRRARPSFSHVQYEGDCYLLNPQIQIWVDDWAFEEHVRAGRQLEAEGKQAEAIVQYGIAESLYQGDYLEEDLYEDWPAQRRQRLRRIYCDINDKLGNHYVQHAEYSTAIALCHRVLSHDNCHEPAHRRLMRCYLVQGQRHLAVRQYLTCAETLQKELDLAPSKETEALYRRIARTP